MWAAEAHAIGLAHHIESYLPRAEQHGAQEAPLRMNFPQHFASLRLAASTIVLHRDHAGNVTQRPMLNRAGRRALAKAYATAARAQKRTR